MVMVVEEHLLLSENGFQGTFNNIEGKKISQPQITAADSNAEYVYIIEDKEVWFIDYIVGIAFKTPIDLYFGALKNKRSESFLLSCR